MRMAELVGRSDTGCQPGTVGGRWHLMLDSRGDPSCTTPHVLESPPWW
jgi:hypothetical protein